MNRWKNLHRAFGHLSWCTILAFAAGTACVPANEAPQLESESGLGMHMSAITATCSSGAIDFAELGSVSLNVTVEGPNADGNEVVLTSASGSWSPDGGSFDIGSVPAGNDRVLTVKANTSQGGSLFGRAYGISVLAKNTTNQDMLLVPSEGFGCLQVPTDFGNLLFPAVTSLPDGRIVIAGGFQAVEAQGGLFVIKGASDEVFILDGERGTFQRVPELMANPRGAAGATYLPQSQRVVIYGGASALRYDPNENGDFPFSFIGTDAENSYDVIDIAALDKRLTDPTSPDQVMLTNPPPAGAPNTMKLRRAFPRGILLETDDALLVSGGGQWPQDPSDFLQTDTYHPDAFNGAGGFLSANGALKTNVKRTGHSITPLGFGPGGKRRALLWGGTNSDADLGEVFIQGTTQSEPDGTPRLDGTFIPAVVLPEGTDPLPRAPYFHHAFPLSSNQVLVVGGVETNGSKLGVDNSNNAYLLNYSLNGSQHQITVKRIPGLSDISYFGAAGVTWNGRVATVMGGWTGSNPTPATNIFVADLTQANPSFSATATGPGLVFDGRGGLGSHVMANDALLLVGGTFAPEQISPTDLGRAETFVPVEVSK